MKQLFYLWDGQLTVFVTTGIVDRPPRTLVTHIPGPCSGHSRLQQQRPASIHSLWPVLSSCWWSVLLQSISQNNWPLSAPNFPIQTQIFAP